MLSSNTSMQPGWSRAGCRTCKRRKKKCDNLKPSCGTCMRLNIRCDGYASPWTAPLTKTDNQYKGRRPRELLSPSEHALAVCEPTCPRPGPTPWLLEASDTDLFYLQYHDERIANALVHIDSEENPLRCLLLPRARTDPLLRDVVCALSAMHFYRNVLRPPNAKCDALRYYCKAVSAMRPLLQSMGQQHERAGLKELSHETLLLAVTWLCNYEVVDSGTQHWRSHLNALQAVLLSPGVSRRVDPEVMRFVRSISTYIRNVALLTTRKTSTSDPCLAKSVSETLPAEVDNYLGYTGEIMGICVRISNLRALGTKLPLHSNELFDIGRRLSHWHLDETSAMSHKLPRGVSADSKTRLRSVASLYYYSTIIYLHSVIAEANRNESTGSDNVANKITIYQNPRREALVRFCQILQTNELGHHCEYSALVFPLFIAACEARSESEQQLISRALSRLETTFGIGNVSAAIEIVQRVWASQGQQTWFEVLDQSDWDLVLA